MLALLVPSRTANNDRASPSGSVVKLASRSAIRILNGRLAVRLNGAKLATGERFATRTVTVKEHRAVCPAGSAAMPLTVVVPSEKSDPDGGSTYSRAAPLLS